MTNDTNGVWAVDDGSYYGEGQDIVGLFASEAAAEDFVRKQGGGTTVFLPFVSENPERREIMTMHAAVADDGDIGPINTTMREVWDFSDEYVRVNGYYGRGGGWGGYVTVTGYDTELVPKAFQSWVDVIRRNANKVRMPKRCNLYVTEDGRATDPDGNLLPV